MNSNIIRANIELASLRDVDAVLRIDANLNSTKPLDYISKNKLSYYTCINTWLLCIKDWSSFGWIEVKSEIIRNGLIPTISRFSKVAQCIVNKEAFDDVLIQSIIHDVNISIQEHKNVPVTDDHLIGDDPVATVLFLLRYPKRLSPVSSDIIRKDSIDKFLSVENRSKLLQRREYPVFMIDELRNLLAHSLPWAKICKRIEKLDASDISFTTGVGFDSSSSLGSKLNAISKTNPEYYYSPFNTSQDISRLQVNPEYYGIGCTDGNPHKIFEKRSVKISAVPKSYKAARIIATENTFRQSMAKRIFMILDEYLPKSIDLHSQARNQEMAYYGSCYGIYSTTDLSNASDCITKSLVKSIFPHKFWTLIEPYIPTHFIIDGKERLMQQFSTAGNSLTFVIESLVFWSIAKCAINRYISCDAPVFEKTKREMEDIAMYYGIDIPDPSCSVYGDDIIVWDPATPFLLLYLHELGFIINEDKSFSGGINLYRESCGKEYYKGTDLTSLYYPRSPIEGSISQTKVLLSNSVQRDSFSGELFDSTVKLVDLQHKLYAVCYPASIFLSEIVTDAHPKMTKSQQGSLYGDLWGYSDTSREKPIKYVVTDTWGTYGVRKDGSQVLLSTFEKKHVSDHPTITRVGRYLPRVEFQNTRKLTELDYRLYNLYKYQQFLKYGPRYITRLDKLLNVSSPSPSIKEVFGIPKMIWKIRF